MSRTRSWVTKKFRSVLYVIHARRYHQSTYGRKGTVISAANGYYWMNNPGLKFFSTNSNTSSDDSNRLKNVKLQPPRFNFPYWLRWVLGSVLSLLLPFWKHDNQRIKRIEGEAEFVIEEVEKVANVVEKVAMLAEKVSEEVAEKLPEDGNLKKAALVVEHLSKEAAHDAQLTLEFIHKVDDLKNDVNDLESFVEPVIDNIVKKKSETTECDSR